MFHSCQICSKSILTRYSLCIPCLSDKVSKEAKLAKKLKSIKDSCSTCGSTDLITLAQRLASMCSFCGSHTPGCYGCESGESVGMKQAVVELKMAGKNPKKLCCRNIDC